jgi:hypothetical protein
MIYLIVVGWVAFSLYLICIGILIITNKGYNKYISKLWFKSESEKQEKDHQFLVKIINGPGYILFGLFFLTIGIFLLDINYGILNQFAFLRSLLNFSIRRSERER